MARNTKVEADHNAPPVTQILAKFVATHPSRGWSDAVDHEAHRTFMNWVGCAVGAARHESAEATLAAVKIGLAASQPLGMREQFGTMPKPFHPGGAARAGLTSALLAANGFTASAKAIEAPRGFAQVVSPKYDWNEITGELGSRFEISFNTYKPFACDIVIHPTIDAAPPLAARGVQADAFVRLAVRGQPPVLQHP